ncbi:MAG: hypothetical protein KDE27_14955, partial [Planctomycetes bacterium]|nr:hypothetical protein [Planctomycetota bacterium]
DAAGEGDGNPRLFAWLHAGADGRFTVETILPGGYGGAPPHFHFGMTRDPVRRGRGSRVYFDDGSPMHPEIASDAAAGHAYVARLAEQGGALYATATFVLRD